MRKEQKYFVIHYRLLDNIFTNYNLDFRYERYPRPGDMITIGGFFKYLYNKMFPFPNHPIGKTTKCLTSGNILYLPTIHKCLCAARKLLSMFRKTGRRIFGKVHTFFCNEMGSHKDPSHESLTLR